jgi:hypothetical protein
MRVGDPALMLLRSDAQFDPETKRRIRADVLRALPDPTTDWDDPNGRLWIKRVLLALAIVAVATGLRSLAQPTARGRLTEIRNFELMPRIQTLLPKLGVIRLTCFQTNQPWAKANWYPCPKAGCRRSACPV